MCIVAIVWQVFNKMPVVLLSNRDEVLSRSTLSAHQWQDLPIFAGRDNISGGTWLGHAVKTDNKQNKWATVLNFRDESSIDTTHSSRGQLVTDFLTNNISPMNFAKQIKLTDYAGFNLIIGNDKQAVLVNNRGYPPTALHDGLHVISNGQPDDEWFKCERLRKRVYQELLPLIAQEIDASAWQESEWQEVAFDVLSDTFQADDNNLPDTGIAKHIEKALASIFVEHGRLEDYGTRTQSVLTLKTCQYNGLNKHYFNLVQRN